MSHFYAAIPTSARRTMPTARAHTSTGVAVYAASWDGRIRTYLWHDEETGEDRFEVSMTPHEGKGDLKAIASGVVGKSKTIRRGAWHDRHAA